MPAYWKAFASLPETKTHDRVLIVANRGKIACRTVALYSAADASTAHICDGDKAMYIEPLSGYGFVLGFARHERRGEITPVPRR